MKTEEMFWQWMNGPVKRAIFPSVNMNGNRLLQNAKKGLIMNGHYALVGPVRLKQSRVRLLNPTLTSSRDYSLAVAGCRRGTAIEEVTDFYGPCYLPYQYALRDRPPSANHLGEVRASTTKSTESTESMQFMEI